MKSKIAWLLVLSVILNIFLVLIYFVNKSNYVTPVNENEKGDILSFAPVSKSKSGRITKGHSDSLRSDYRGDRKHLKTIDSTVDVHKSVALEGFVFDADQIREIVNDNKSGKKPDQVAIYFGLISHGGVIGIGKKRNWHLITLGRYQGTLLDYNKDDPKGAISAVPALPLKEASIFDKAVPCPPCTQ